MMHIHWRLAELWLLQQKRGLTELETSEMNSCLKLNAKYAQRLAEQYNLGQAASMTNDTAWLQEISAEIDRMERYYESRRPSYFES